jgi:NAD(P)-dependent dehydrogenase (short-subunit alcohol dehydrogenase family)
MSTTGTAIVTGGSQGIGAGLVTRFLEKGYNVVGNSRAISKSRSLAPSPRLALVDIGDCATAQEIADTAIAQFGRIDVLVNNAGLLLAKPFIDYTSGDFEALVSTILAGFFYISQNAAKQMLRQQSGHIVNISTSVVDQPIAGVPCALQVLTKGGLHAVARALAIEYAGQGIRVNRRRRASVSICILPALYSITPTSGIITKLLTLFPMRLKQVEAASSSQQKMEITRWC